MLTQSGKIGSPTWSSRKVDLRYTACPRIAPNRLRSRLGRDIGAEQHRAFAGAELAPVQAGQRALGGTLADTLRDGEFAGQPAAVVPVVALHVVAVLRDHRAAQAVARARVAADKAMAVAVDEAGTLGVDGRAFGVADPRIAATCRVFALARDAGGLVGAHLPGMIQVEIGDVARHQLGIGQPGGRVFRGVAGDPAGGGDGLANRLGAQVGGAGGALALAEIHA